MPEPGAGLALFAPVHATLLPPGTMGPSGTAIPDFRVMLFGKAGDRVKAAWFTPTPFGQTVPPVVFLTPETIPHMPTRIYDDGDGNHWFHSDTLFCSGHSFMADGDLFVAGGTELYSISNPDRTATLDANQRHVQLALAAPPTPTTAVVIGPPDRQTAPPGHYMLFVLNGARVPSVARIVHLQ